MFKRNRMIVLLLIVLVVGLVAACQPQTQEVVKEVPVEVTRIITETVTEEGQSVEVTRVVTEEVVVTATPAPEQQVSLVAPHPDTYTWLTYGDIDTMDPNLAYDTASANLIQNVMEGLIYYNHTDPTSFVPQLATEVPSIENGGISEDGMTYTFNIRQGVKFHNGNDLTASDFAYTFQRGLLQSDPNGPQWLLLEPILGYTSGDVTESIADGAYAGDRDALIANATPEELTAVCENVKAAIVADDDAGTLTFNLAQPWGPFLATVAQTWGMAIDKEWAMDNGAWDGSCDTWINYYAPGSENDELTGIINGTGPYMLDHWTPGVEYVLVANPNYWRPEGEPLWEGGPSGQPRIQTVFVQLVNEWGTRFASLQAGDAEEVTVPPENRPQIDEMVGEICNFRTLECTPTENPNGSIRKWSDLPNPSRTDVFLNFDVAVDDQGKNPYIGSGQLDGNGIPPNFFSDIHVRRAFNYCFDYDTYISEALNGEGVRNNGPIILDMLGYNPDGPMYEFDLDKCAEELAAAWDGALPDTGFRLQVAFNTGNTTRQTIGEILQNSMSQINDKYQVETVGLPWPTLLAAFRAKQLPVAVSGWVEDIHDPHNWVQPFTVGTYAGRQNLPEDLKMQFQELVNSGVAATDAAEREQIYYDLQQLHHDEAIQITLAQITGARYEQRWVQDWFYNPIINGGYYYAYGLATE
ncbi:MAG: ABC transporter substrate-binding protein [Ardenticatenaceae bacterium]|nr:ABC transporter substrate-binding protein [Ardenticatenaceae bacterium]MCB8987314.1 ABC transporter substrate-binding protein [Ardenticatenaceae bacterium]